MIIGIAVFLFLAIGWIAFMISSAIGGTLELTVPFIFGLVAMIAFLSAVILKKLNALEIEIKKKNRDQVDLGNQSKHDETVE